MHAIVIQEVFIGKVEERGAGRSGVAESQRLQGEVWLGGELEHRQLRLYGEAAEGACHA